MGQHHTEGTFQVASFVPVDVTPAVEIVTAMEAGVATMEKVYAGGVEGRSATLFTGARNAESGAGAYVALESFEGSLDGAVGTFNFVHVASTHGEDRYAESFSIVDASGTGELAGISGGGALVIDSDGTHRISFDYTLG